MGKDSHWWITRHGHLSVSQDVCEEEKTSKRSKVGQLKMKQKVVFYSPSCSSA